MTPANDHVMIPNQTGWIIAGGCALALLGGSPILSHFVQGFADEPAPVSLVIAGWVILAIGLVLIASPFWATRKRWLEADAYQLRYVDPRYPNEQWQLNWQDIDGIELRVAQLRRSSPLELVRPTRRVRLVLYTGARREPLEFRSLRKSAGVAGQGTVSMFFGDLRALVEPLDEFLRRTAGFRYQGVINEGRVRTPL